MTLTNSNSTDTYDHIQRRFDKNLKNIREILEKITFDSSTFSLKNLHIPLPLFDG